MTKIKIDTQLKKKILKGRKVVNAYREAHAQLYSNPWYKGIPEEHTPLLSKMVDTLGKLGFTSTKTDFEPKKTEILNRFWQASNELNIFDTGIYELSVYKYREDLKMIGEPYSSDGVKLEQTKTGFKLSIDGLAVMNTSLRGQATMVMSVAKCPSSARVFVGGLGLGLILLYLAQSGKTTEVIVSEIDERVINLMEHRIRAYLTIHYPDFNFSIMQGDALEEIIGYGKFDWILFDLAQPVPLEVLPKIKSALTITGIFSDSWDIAKSWWR